MEKLYPKLILDALAQVRYPGNGKNLIENNMVEDDIRIDGNKVSFTLVFEKANDPFTRSIVKAAEAAIHAYASEEAEVTIAVKSRVAPRPTLQNPLPGVKNIIAVASNLAVALARAGYKTGLLDADIFGPSAPKMFNIEDEQVYAEERDGHSYIIPIEKYDVKILSIGFFVRKDDAVLWRGGMASNALKQLITEADWGELDYFVLDLPPGTSDIHLTLVQTLAITGAIVVTTPQEVALADARKGISMFTGEKVNVPILGLVENMSWFTPAELPNNRYYLFGKEGGKRLAEEMHVALLGQIPIVQSICESGDAGHPVALDDTAAGEAFRHLAEEVVKATEKRNREQPATQKVEMQK